jgi:hypothetical protein
MYDQVPACWLLMFTLGPTNLLYDASTRIVIKGVYELGRASRPANEA